MKSEGGDYFISGPLTQICFEYLTQESHFHSKLMNEAEKKAESAKTCSSSCDFLMKASLYNYKIESSR